MSHQLGRTASDDKGHLKLLCLWLSQQGAEVTGGTARSVGIHSMIINNQTLTSKSTPRKGKLTPRDHLQVLIDGATLQPCTRLVYSILLAHTACCCMRTGVTFLNAKVDSVSHADGSSTVKAADGRLLRGSLVLDATGHSRKLVEYDQPFNPGYQGAYGIMAGEHILPLPDCRLPPFLQ